jgi:hypothetical protein
MRHAISILALVLVAVLLSGMLSFGAIRRGVIAPPTGTLRAGPVTIMALPPCPTIPHGSLVPWGRRCGSASAWAVWAIVRTPNGEPQQWQLMRAIVDP